MEDILQWFNDNKDWLFSGLGVALVIYLFDRFRKKGGKNGNVKMTQKSGKDSKSYQAGRDINVK